MAQLLMGWLEDASGEAPVGGRVRNGHAQQRTAMLRCLHVPSVLVALICRHSDFESAPHAIEKQAPVQLSAERAYN